MITIYYDYDGDTVLKLWGNEAEKKRLPRQDEFVEIDEDEYRVESITYSFENTPQFVGKTVQQNITVELTKRFGR